MPRGGAPQPIAPLAFSISHVQYGIGSDLRSQGVSSSQSALTWIANLALFVPIMVPFDFPLARFWWSNGSTLTSSNVDVGVYSAAGTLIANAGTTAQSGTNVQQYAAPSGGALILKPDRYYLGIVDDHTTARLTGTTSASAAQLRMCGCLQQTLGSASLPATITAAVVANALLPIFGITQAPSGY